MQIPTRLKIGAHTYSIRKEKPNKLGNDRDGYHDPAQEEIVINSEYGETHQWATVFHEMIHALNSELDEPTVEFLAQGITQVLLDNRIITVEYRSEGEIPEDMKIIGNKFEA